MIPRLACRNECGFIALGLLLIAAGLLLNRWTLGQILVSDGQISGEWRKAQIAGVQPVLVLSGVLLTLSGIRDWGAAARWRLAAVALALTAVSGLLMFAGFGSHIYLSQHQHTLVAATSVRQRLRSCSGPTIYDAAGRWHWAMAGSISRRPQATVSNRRGATASVSSSAPTCVTTKC